MLFGVSRVRIYNRAVVLLFVRQDRSEQQADDGLSKDVIQSRDQLPLVHLMASLWSRKDCIALRVAILFLYFFRIFFFSIFSNCLGFSPHGRVNGHLSLTNTSS